MNCKPLTVILLLIVLALLRSFGSVLSAPTGPTDYLLYLPLIQRSISWNEVGTGSASGGGISNSTLTSSVTPSLAIAPDGTLYVIWIESRCVTVLDILRWDGSHWVEVGTITGALPYTPSIAIGPDGTPYVAWSGYSNFGNQFDIYVLAWDGTSWVEVGVGSASGGGISNTAGNSEQPSIAVAPDGTPYVAWEDNSDGDTEIYIRAWNGSSWTEVGTASASGGGISNNAGDSSSPSLAIAPDGAPYVTWEDDSSGDTEIYVRAWNGSNWAEVGAGSATNEGISNNTTGSYAPSLAIASDGTPYAAWHDDSDGDTEIYIRAWNGSSWAEVEAGSASGGGISNNSGASNEVSLEISNNGIPYITWSDESSGNTEIYVLTWNGSDSADGKWEKVGASSASGGGISNNLGKSRSPSLGIAPGGTPYIAWSDYSSGNYEIYILGYGYPQSTSLSHVPAKARTPDCSSTIPSGLLP